MTIKSEGYTMFAQKTVSFAEVERQRLGHQYIGTEHLLLGLIQAEDSLATKILVEMGLDLDEARERVLEIITPTDTNDDG